MAYDNEKQQALNREHVTRPQPGDYWHEMFIPYCVVVWADGEHVEVLDAIVHRKDLGDGWTWDVSRPLVRMTYEELRKSVTYGLIEGFCADVAVGTRHQDFVAPALAARKRMAP